MNQQKKSRIHFFATFLVFFSTSLCTLLCGISSPLGSLGGVFAQNIGISSTGATPDASAMLDVVSSTSGFLLPRMTNTERNTIPAPATGLIIYSTTINYFNVYTPSGWFKYTAIDYIGNTTGATAPGKGVAFNSTGASSASVAICDISSTIKGLLIPRTTTGSISSPATGLMIYNTAANALSYYNGSSWITPCSQLATVTTGGGSLAGTPGVGINAAASVPDVSAMLDISSTTKGLLIPRMSDANRDNLNPVTGLIIYNTTTNLLNYWNGSGWYSLSSTVPSQPSTITGTTPVTQSQTGVAYSVTNVVGATYTWTYSGTGFTCASGCTTNSITADFSSTATSGTLTITPSNACGNGTARTLAITVNPPPPTCGTQVWASANLDVGTMITTATAQSNNSTVEKWCYNDDPAMCATYGGLYQWNEAMNWVASVACDPCGPTTGNGGVQGQCPAGYHIPSDLEWSRYEYCVESTIVPTGATTLATFQNNTNYRGTNSAGIGPGDKMKVTSGNTPAWNGTNTSGFSALAAGWALGGSSLVMGTYSPFWSATESSGANGFIHHSTTGNAQAYRFGFTKAYGVSIRCLKD